MSLRQVLDHAAEHGYGVPAFNLNTEAMRQSFAQHPREFDPRKASIEAEKAARAIVKARFEAFGCAGHAARLKQVALESMVARYR
ncbi:MAG: hypothetical protein ABIQ60_06275 [Burkholderiaceae bacterium]